MIREILFRGIRLSDRGWTYGSLIKFINQYVIFSVEGDYSGAYDVEQNTIGQYTGIIDKNGSKIFEGDVIFVDECTIPFLVEFVGSSWVCTNKTVWPLYLHRLEQNYSKYQVAGNIHDTPDILSGKGRMEDR